MLGVPLSANRFAWQCFSIILQAPPPLVAAQHSSLSPYLWLHMYTSGECSEIEGGSAGVWVWGALGRVCVACMSVLGSESM